MARLYRETEETFEDGFDDAGGWYCAGFPGCYRDGLVRVLVWTMFHEADFDGALMGRCWV